MKNKIIYCLLGILISAIAFEIVSYYLTGNWRLRREFKKEFNLKEPKTKLAYPLPYRIYNDMTQNFALYYKAGNTNSEIDNESFFIPIREFIKLITNNDVTNYQSFLSILNNNPNKENVGINFAYTISHHAFSYVLYNTNKNTQFEPNKKYRPPLSGSNFIKLPNVISSPGTGAEFDSFNYYIKTVSINRFSGINRDGIGELELSPLDSCHPRNCFYSYSAIHDFFKDNQSILTLPGGSINPEIYVVIDNGAVFLPVTSPRLNDYKLQTPMILFADYKRTRFLNETNILDHSLPYYKSALDIGLLCPPDCPK